MQQEFVAKKVATVLKEEAEEIPIEVKTTLLQKDEKFIEEEEDKEFTKKFLELLNVYCDVMQEYPGLVQKIEEFRTIVRSKE